MVAIFLPTLTCIQTVHSGSGSGCGGDVVVSFAQAKRVDL